MNRYIKTNSNNEIIKIFNWFSRSEFDGTEIFLDDTTPFLLTINEKSVLNEYGYPVFIWNGINAVEKTQSEIDSDPEFITWYKQLKKAELQAYIGLHTLDILNNHTWTEIVTQWNSFKSNASSLTAKQDIDNAFDTAINWLNT